MKSIKQQRLEFLTETISYYSEDVNRRAVNDDKSCFYYEKETGNKCAIGRHIKLEDYRNNKIEGYGVYSYKVFALLPETIRRLGKDFLEAMQQLHDSEYHWDNKGLTDKGSRYVRSIINSYC